MNEKFCLDLDRVGKAMKDVLSLDVIACALRFSGINKAPKLCNKDELYGATRKALACVPKVLEEEKRGAFYYSAAQLKVRVMQEMMTSCPV